MHNVKAIFNLDLEDYMAYKSLEEGHVYLVNELDNDLVYGSILSMNEMVRLGVTNITMHINSIGGFIFSSFTLYDYINLIKCKNGIHVTSVVEGEACSAASMIVMQAADERLACENSRIMIHEPYEFIEGGLTVTKYKDRSKEMDTVTKMVMDILSDRCNKTSKEIMKVIKNTDVFMRPSEALEFGIIDGILK